MFADLHLHTNMSDGLSTPARVVEIAAGKGFSCLSITDHDTMAGLAEATAAGDKLGVEVIAGIEISTRVGERSVHILGYLMDMNNRSFRRIVDENCEGRLKRMKSMINKLNDLGYDIDYEETLEYIGPQTVGRALLARYMVDKGLFDNVNAVFDTLLGDGKPVCEPLTSFTPEDAIGLVSEAGGVSSLAHPGHTNIDQLIPGLAKAGLDGIEAYNTLHQSAMTQKYEKMADELGLLLTGGSDYHGPGMAGRYIGSVKLPYRHVERLRERASSRAGQEVNQ